MASANATLTKSIIELTPASAAFVLNRVTTLGPWVVASYLDAIMMGIVMCQAYTFFRTRALEKTTFQQYCLYLVLVILGLSVLKTMQEITVVWVQNVHDFANPDVARLRVSTAWWQVSTPLMTGVIGVLVQSFFCVRSVLGHSAPAGTRDSLLSAHSLYLLSRNWIVIIPIVCFMTLGITGICLTVFYILSGNAVLKVRWLLIHLVGVFIADFCITTATFLALRKRSNGLERTNILINRLLRMIFESAIPPTFIATVDLILTQTLGTKLLWHLLFNFSLGKIYVISLLYTLNSINQYRRKHSTSSQEVYTSDGRGAGIGRDRFQRNNVELATIGSTKPDQIYIQTQVSTHVSPASGRGGGDRTIQIQTLQSDAAENDESFMKY
ncbi:hypothetical protein GGX14DRAFT_543606 [Mycena pura]|uniref:DUF6534 domain-containing protein n=1 Tax=Mycena pura TaxID=153505 RepID=A0AAD6VAI7_9AGAR|nr:hypothetical protein GGX14DRAFT_543606 [Mycena pura]